MNSDLMMRLVNFTKRVNTLASIDPEGKRAIALGETKHSIKGAARAVAILSPQLMGMSIDPLPESKATTVTMLAKEGEKLFHDLAEAGAIKSAQAVNKAITEMTASE
ncbi:hypothetical protein [Bifidobacterium callitrichidarum]|uniref:Uncharacterized protein n=1 Tax=Bifidobacterium callitrichidarum TaxID=2052941 RepID=A0A2U2NCH5_9BIFI|nr:hypothetical protein [Bifidobacterium callitrichidarum]PWG66734.1 hypothetical protein DF196_02190 [Bifidobacterium callitrichidarum]